MEAKPAYMGRIASKRSIMQPGGIAAAQKEWWMTMKTDIVICSKCNGSGKFIYKSGMTGPCYQCNGKGSVKRIPHKSFQISIVDNDGVRIDWLNVNAGSENAAVSKARVIAARGCYKDQIGSIKAVENGIDYTYKPI